MGLRMNEGLQTVLDVCCGSRMFWFNKRDPRAVYLDKRREKHSLTDSSSRGGRRALVIDPDTVGDFTNLPYPENLFYIVVFDPPHLFGNGKNGWLAKKYGKLDGDWRGEIRTGFKECFRVLRPGGSLIFKWNETDIPVSEILKLTDELPLFGNQCGKSSKSHWIVFMKAAP